MDENFFGNSTGIILDDDETSEGVLEKVHKRYNILVLIQK